MKRPLGRFHIHSPFQKACQQPRAESACYHFFPISEFSYKLIRLLLHSPVIKSDNEIDKFSYKNMECPRRTPPRTFCWIFLDVCLDSMHDLLQNDATLYLLSTYYMQ